MQLQQAFRVARPHAACFLPKFACQGRNLVASPAINRTLQHFPLASQFRKFQVSVVGHKRGFIRCMGSSPAAGLEQVDKRPRMTKRVGTHNGTFHCDEALGCFMLLQTEKYKGAEIVRTRNQEVLDTLDAVLDVGGVYDPSKDRFDHHQRGFDHVFGHGFTTKLSSAGLVYKHFGKELVAKEVGLDAEHPNTQVVYLAVYKNFMEALDAIDNGVNQYDSDQPPKYTNNTHLSARVGRFNPDWMEKSTEELENAQFRKAMALAGEEFMDSVQYYAKSWLPGRSIVAECLKERHQVDPSGEIMRLKQFCPWKSHIDTLEKDLKVEPLIKYVLYEDDRGGSWRVQAVSVSPGSFESRKPLPKAWRGLRDDELSKETGVPGGVFVHMSGFIGGNRTYDGALEMARKALTME